MNELLSSFTSTSWWLGVVFVGVTINVISAYLKGPIDRLFSSLSIAWQERTEKSRQERESTIAALREDQHLQVIFLARASDSRSTELTFLIFAVFFTLFGLQLTIEPSETLRIFLKATAGFCLIAASSSGLNAYRLRNLVAVANRAGKL